MMHPIRTVVRVSLLLVVAVATASAAVAAPSPAAGFAENDQSVESDEQVRKREAEIQKRMADRLPLIRKLKTDGKIGETWQGTLAATEDADPDDVVESDPAKGTKVTLREFVAKENDDRNAIYKILADRRSTPEQVVTPEYVAAQSAKTLERRAEPGDYQLLKSGKWVRKPKPPAPGAGA